MCLSTRLRTFDARVSFCYSLSSMAFFYFLSQQKQDKRQFLQNISADKQTADMLLAMRMVLTNIRLLLKYFCYGLNVNENNTSHRFSVILACAVAV